MSATLRPDAKPKHKLAPKALRWITVVFGKFTFGPVWLRRGEVDGTRTRDPRRDRPIL